MSENKEIINHPDLPLGVSIFSLYDNRTCRPKVGVLRMKKMRGIHIVMDKDDKVVEYFRLTGEEGRLERRQMGSGSFIIHLQK